MRLARRLFDAGFGGRRFTDEVASELQGGRSTLVIVPSSLPVETLGEAVRQRLWDRGLDVQTIDVTAGAAGSPSLTVARELGIDEVSGDLVDLEDRVRNSP